MVESAVGLADGMQSDTQSSKGERGLAVPISKGSVG